MYHDIDTVEMKWITVAQLPYKLSGVKAVNYNNQIFAFGKDIIYVF